MRDHPIHPPGPRSVVPRRALWLDPLKGLLLFGVLGSALPPWILFAMTGPSLEGLGSLVKSLFLAAALGLMFGGIPAAATGLAAGVLRSRGYLYTWGHCIAVAVVGGACSALYGWWMQDGADDVSLATVLAVPGFAAAFVCALIFRRHPARAPA